MTANRKILCAVLLFSVWTGFVAAGLSPVEPLLQSVRDALLAIGVFTASLTNPKE